MSRASMIMIVSLAVAGNTNTGAMEWGYRTGSGSNWIQPIVGEPTTPENAPHTTAPVRRQNHNHGPPNLKIMRLITESGTAYQRPTQQIWENNQPPGRRWAQCLRRLFCCCGTD
ncbi:MAG: hypothetical protein LBD43_01425 [Holosporales bacterium]|nr:hypothetical protein [Holosporales bacterium]